MVRHFDALPGDARAMAGGKGASLARMAQAGLPVPPGFVVCAEALARVLDADGRQDRIRGLVRGLDVEDAATLEQRAAAMRTVIQTAPLPPDLEQDIRDACRQLGEAAPVAVRSSAIAEDGDAASFAGQQETYLNVQGTDAVLEAIRSCWASFFTPRALFYRARHGALDDLEMAVVVQEMVSADKSGVMFTIDPVSGRRDRVVIEAVLGLGEGLVSGEITPDHYAIDRERGTMAECFVTTQLVAVVTHPDGGTRRAAVPVDRGSLQVLDFSEIDALRQLGVRLEQHFGSPQDVEWAIAGPRLVLLQSRPVTAL
jgi:pyruvate,water dikinase